MFELAGAVAQERTAGARGFSGLLFCAWTGRGRVGGDLPRRTTPDLAGRSRRSNWTSGVGETDGAIRLRYLRRGTRQKS